MRRNNRRSKRNRNNKKGAPLWMVTYSDLVTLVLVFFILLFSMSQVDMTKFKAVSDSFNKVGIFQSSSSILPEDGRESVSDETETGTPHSLDSLVQEVESYLKSNGMENVITANRNERGVVLVLQEQVLFETGQADLIEDSFGFLEKLGIMLKEMPNLIRVEGHTDNRPIETYRYPSNWELSSARASSVIRYLVENNEIEPSRFTAVGYGETRPIVANNSSENWEKNRRVEVIILDPEYNHNEAMESSH
ncbi:MULTISPECIES: flagellar motor protein MotS [Cytobacillus]|uniref:Flagellar motor protein MotB n=1 Tax=Cytobacillus stercorigallinarum TaxID=2762240 RepID=A0ABR8QJ14_9BACI|nr:flagellar motor protein MotS [Cytobacillus stercorigallinarum]MBD7935514.1 flagellar motor protein MotB [Cytobacillus stercorigallinarum]